MEQIVVLGSKPLAGTVRVQGAKNSVLPILAATLLVDGICTIKNAPQLLDVINCAKILGELGAEIKSFGNTLTVTRKQQIESKISKDLMNSMRSSIFFLAPLVAKTGMAAIYEPGGCVLGERPIDMHLEGLQKLGAVIKFVDDKVLCFTENGLCGDDVFLRFPSVGATETLIMSAVTALGKTVIHNAAKEPEVVDLADFLIACGAVISGAGSDTITVFGVKKLTGCTYTIIPDRIETATFMCAAVATRGKILIENTCPQNVTPLIRILRSCGADISCSDTGIDINCTGVISAGGYLETGVFPKLATDTAPLLAAAMLTADGLTIINDTIFTDRFRCAEGFEGFGAEVSKYGGSIHIYGRRSISGASVCAPDLRGGAALLIAALCAQGQSKISGIKYISRGYQNIVNTYKSLGADINYIKG